MSLEHLITTTIRWLRPKQEVIVRMIADAVLLNVALVAALIIRYVYVTAFELPADEVKPFWVYASAYRNSFWLFTPLLLGTLYAHGVYTVGRSYRKRAKVILVGRAVTIAHLIYGFGSYFVAGAFYFPRGALVLAWALTGCLLITARAWTWLWLMWAGYSTHPKGADVSERKVSRVLVIGGAGYIGSEVVRLLLERGYAVRILDRLIYGKKPLEGILSHERLELVEEDFRKVDQVVESMQGVDAVIHLGAIVGDPACALDERLTIQINLTATRMVAEVAKGVGVNRFIFASTCSVYGASDEILDESSVLRPVSLYAKSKIASEEVLRALADRRFAPVILRFGTIYGLSGRTRFDLVANLMSATAAFEGQITVRGANQWRPFVHVADAARAVVDTLDAPLALVRNRALNVGSDEQNYTIGQVAQIVAQQVPGARIVEHGTDGDRRNYRVSFAAIRRTIGFQPKWTLAQGVGQVLQAIKAGSVGHYSDPMFSNVRFLSEEGLNHLAIDQRDWEEELLRRSDTGSKEHQVAAMATRPV